MSNLVRCLLLLLLLAAARPTMSQRSRTDTLVVHFDFDRSTLRPADAAALAGAHPGADSLLILGYTDTVGSNGYNLRLSRLRAEATRTALLKTLLPAPPIRLDPRGENNALPGDDSLSRRVEVIVFYQVKDTPVIVRAPPVDTPKARPDDEPDTAFSLNNINFIANTPVLTDAAREAMPHAVAILRTYKDRYLEIDGFCNQPGPPLKSTDILFILSIKRAKYIYDYLIEQGFDSTHLRYKGMGNASPMVSHPTTKQEMDQNMRVQIRVFRKPQPQQNAGLP